MKISLNWLNELVDIKNEDKKQLAERITRAGVAVESITKLCEATNLTIGHVLERTNHPASDHLNVCKVDLGDEIVQIVCGANNVTNGIKVIVAKVGAKLPGDIEIKKAIIRDIDSNGMICALSELGLPDKEDNHGIHILPSDAIVGSDPLTLLGYDDVIYDLDLNPNRHDCLSLMGMAYETAAVLKKDVVLPNTKAFETVSSASEYINVKSLTDNCKLYLARVVQNVVIKESPEFIKSRLIASGIRPINNVVDISNYVMLEYGQPLHFFDYNKIGKEVNIRMATDNEQTMTLDKQTRTLTKDDIVITNGSEIVAIAGVMGCHNSEVTELTTNILIESAIFNPYNVRYTSINQNLRSEASLRFEKGLDPKSSYDAINRAVYLLQQYASGEVTSGIVKYDEYNQDDITVSVTLTKINEVLGMTLTNNEVKDVFERLKFNYILEDETYNVTVPTRRLDITIKEDIIEEIGRLYGYDNIVAKIPIGTTKRGKYTPHGKYRKLISNHLESLGLSQVKTYGLISSNESNMFTNDIYEPITLLMPMSEDKKYLRYSILPSLLSVVNYNAARSIKDIMIYETSNIYYKKGEEFIEEEKLAGIMNGTYLSNNWQNKKVDIDFYLGKGIIESLLDYLGLNGRYTFDKEDITPNDYHPGRTAVIKIDNQKIGYVGMIHPSTNKLPMVVFELSISKLLDLKVREIKYKDIPKYPVINRDFAVIVDKNIKSSDIIRTIKKAGGKALISVEIFDLYTGDNIANGSKSLAFNLMFQDLNRTLVDEEVTLLFNDILKEVEKVYSGILRTK